MYLLFDSLTNEPLGYARSYAQAYQLICDSTFKPHAMKDMAEVDDSCKWFHGCDKAAVTSALHPILGDVPVCMDHRKFATE
jgi:hypothetical protein